MKTTILVLSVLACASAHASTPKAPEVYPSTEGGMSEPMLEVNPPAPAADASSDDAERAKLAAHAEVPAPTQTRAPEPAPAPAVAPVVAKTAPAEKEAYDPVPSDQKDALARRLKLVEAIIQKYGRAYDYRIHTVHELEGLLQRLDSAEKSAAKS